MRFLIFFLFSLSFQSSAGEKIPAENDSIIQYFNDCENPKGLAKGFCEARYKLMRNAIEERKKELMKRIDQAICDHDLPAIIRVLECSGFDINIQIPDYKRNQETKNGNYTVGLLTRASDEGFWEGLQYFFDKKVLVDKYKIFRVIKNTVEKDAPFELFELLLKSFNPSGKFYEYKNLYTDSTDWALEKKALEKAKLLLAYGANISRKKLSQLIKQGNKKALKFLIDMEKISLSSLIPDEHPLSLFCLAVKYEQAEIAQMLLDKGAKVQHSRGLLWDIKKMKWVEKRSQDEEQDYLNLVQSACGASSANTDCLELLFEKIPPSLKSKEKYFLSEIISSNFEMIEANDCIDPVIGIDNSGVGIYEQLCWAVDRYLKISNNKAPSGLLFEVVSGELKALFNDLIDKKVKFTQLEKNRALHIVTLSGDIDIFAKLVEIGADVNSVSSCGDGRRGAFGIPLKTTIREKATRYKRSEILKFIESKNS